VAIRASDDGTGAVRVLMAVVSDIFTDARVRREATALAEAGHEVCVIGFDYSVNKATRRHEDGVEYQLFPFPSRNRPRWARIVGFAVFWMRAAREIMRRPADVIHSHNLHLAVPCAVAARRRRIPLVYDAHEVVDVMLSGMSRRFGNRYEDLMWHRADAVITTNDTRALHLERLHGGPLPTVVGNYPKAPAQLAPVDLRSRCGIPDDALILIYQGGFYVHARCFDRVAEALRSRPKWHFVLIGFGSESSIDLLRQQMEEAGIGDRAHILPPVAAPELLHYTAGADAGVVPLLPVVGNELGDTNKLFEYLLVGKPAIGSDFPEIRRAILDNPIGPVGAVFDPDDIASIGAAVDDLESNLEAYRSRAGDVGHRYYSWATEQQKLVAVYSRLDGSMPPPVGSLRADGAQKVTYRSDAKAGTAPLAGRGDGS
jgi:glycosyltransferase involved in cell wall biosynthesis